MRFPRKRGSTSNMVRIFIPDNSVTTGAGCTGLTSGSTNLTIAYIRTLDGTSTTYTGANIEAQTTIGTFQAPSTSSKIRFKAVDATSFPGLYELQFHDSATAFGSADTSDAIEINIYEATTTALKIGPNMCLIPLVPWDYQDGTAMGLSRLDAAITTRSTYSGTDTAGTTTLLTRLPSAITLSGGAVTVGTNNDKTGYTASTVSDKTGYSLSQTFPTNFSSLAITAGGAVTAGTVSDKTGYTVSTVSDKTGYSLSQSFPANFASLSIDSNGRVKIQGGIPRNTALPGFEFYMALSSDHVSPATGKSISSSVSLNGGTFAGTTNSAVEIGNGWYKIDLAAGDTNGAVVALSFSASSCDTTQITLLTQP